MGGGKRDVRLGGGGRGDVRLSGWGEGSEARWVGGGGEGCEA